MQPVVVVFEFGILCSNLALHLLVLADTSADAGDECEHNAHEGQTEKVDLLAAL